FVTKDQIQAIIIAPFAKTSCHTVKEGKITFIVLHGIGEFVAEAGLVNDGQQVGRSGAAHHLDDLRKTQVGISLAGWAILQKNSWTVAFKDNVLSIASLVGSFGMHGSDNSPKHFSLTIAVAETDLCTAA